MNQSKLLLLTPLLVGMLAGCQNQESSSSDIIPDSSDSSMVDAEAVMNQFIANVEKANYSITNPDHLSIALYGEDLAYIDYAEEDSHDFVYLTVNQNETYTCDISFNEVDESGYRYVGEGNVVDNIGNQLIQSWFAYSPNVWDSFTSYGDDPYKFLIANEEIRYQILTQYALIPEYSFSIIDQIHLIIDQDNSDHAKIDISFHSDRDHLILPIAFDAVKPSLPTDAWMNDENRLYPEAPTEWSLNLVTEFNIVYDQRYDMDQVMPFPAFASRTFHNDPYLTQFESIIYLRDTLASESDMNQYIGTLLQNGYEAVDVTLPSGEAVRRYDLLLDCYKDIYFSYSSCYVEYDEGVTITFQKTYNSIVFIGREAINTFLEKANFLPLPKSENLYNFHANDYTLVQNEGSSYITPYGMAFELEIRYADFEQAERYMDKYMQDLESMGYQISDQSDTHHHTFSSESYSNTVDYMFFPEEETLRMFFRNRPFFSDEEMEENLESIGMIDLHLDEYSSQCKDQTIFYEIMYALFHKKVYDIQISFASEAEQAAYITAMKEALEKNGFAYYANPLEVKVPRKSDAYYHEEKGLILAYNENDSTHLDINVIEVGDGFTPRGSI